MRFGAASIGFVIRFGRARLGAGCVSDVLARMAFGYS